MTAYASEKEFSCFVNTHIKWSVLYLLCHSRRFRDCYEIQLASRRLYTGLAGGRPRSYCLSSPPVSLCDLRDYPLTLLVVVGRPRLPLARLLWGLTRALSDGGSLR